MLKVKKIIFIGLLMSALATPTAALASNGQYYSQSNSSWFEDLFHSFRYGHKESDYRDYIKWYQSWKDHEPDEESWDIWKRWYCS